MTNINTDTLQTIAEFNGVGFHYDKGPEVLKNIQISLKAGAFYFMTGESGAGKTSLLSLLYLAHLPTTGRLRLFGKTVDTLKRKEKALLRRHIGVVFQDYRLLDYLTAFDNVALPLRLADVKETEVKKHVSELLDWVGLTDKMQSLPLQLSGGEQQRIAIARAVINRPKLLIADEPTGNVDEEMARRLLFLFMELNKLGTTVVIATHNENLYKNTDFPRFHLSHGQIELIESNKYKQIAHKLFNAFGAGGDNV